MYNSEEWYNEKITEVQKNIEELQKEKSILTEKLNKLNSVENDSNILFEKLPKQIHHQNKIYYLTIIHSDEKTIIGYRNEEYYIGLYCETMYKITWLRQFEGIYLNDLISELSDWINKYVIDNKVVWH